MTEERLGHRNVSGVEAVAWGAGSVAAANAVRIAISELPGIAIRVLHHLIELGHTLLLGTVASLIVLLWTRFGPKRRLFDVLLVVALAALAAQIVLVEDMQGPLEQLGGDPDDPFSLGALAVLAAMSVPGAFVAGRFVARPRLRWLAVGIGTALVFVNPYLLPGGYSGVHLLLAVTGATLSSSALAGAHVRRLIRRRLPRHVTMASAISCALAGVASVVVRPSSGVEVELERIESAVLVPWLGQYRQETRVADVPVPDEMKPWFERRKKRSPVPPNPRRLLPEGPIVILFSIDAIRNDLMSEKLRDVAPNMHAIREKSIYFSQARSFGAGTRISLSALFAGRYYSMLKWTRPLSTRPTLERDKLPRFPDLLAEEGVDTVNVVSLQAMLVEEIGVVHGFTEEIRRRKKKKGERGEKREQGEKEEQGLTADLTAQAIERLKKQGPDPLFLFMHVLDPHEPYRTYGKRVASKREAYHVEVTLADKHPGATSSRRRRARLETPDGVHRDLRPRRGVR